MKDLYKTIIHGSKAEIRVKKSRFIGTIQPVYTEEEARSFITGVQKSFNDARHNCFAYTIGIEHPIERFSDDREPSGTAGMPILEVIRGSGLNNAAVVITRYFGGVLLGTGGLTRAYGEAAKACIEATQVIEKSLCSKLRIKTDYHFSGRLTYEMNQAESIIYDTIYDDKVTYILLIREKLTESFINEVIELTGGQGDVVNEGLYYTYQVDNRTILEKAI